MSANPGPKPGYRQGVGVLLVNCDGLVFVAQRIDSPGEAWQMPQGGIDEGEEPLAAAFRELEEEIGTRDAEYLAESADWYSYDLPPDIARRLWGGNYAGQTQKWFALRFTGNDGDIHLDGHERPEFSRWKWVELDALPSLIVPFKRRLYEDLVTEFADSIRPLREA